MFDFYSPDIQAIFMVVSWSAIVVAGITLVVAAGLFVLNGSQNKQ